MENRIKHIFLKPVAMAVMPIALSITLVQAAEAEPLSGNDQPLIAPDVRPQKVDEALIDTENFEAGIFMGVINIEDFESSFLYGARVAYHLSEGLFFEGNIGFAEGGDTSAESFIGNVELLSDSEREYNYYNVSIGYNLFPGEAFTPGGYAFNTNFYFVGGIGATDFADDNRLTYNFGAGYQVILNDAFAVNIVAREHLYEIDLLGDDKWSFNTEFSAALSVFF